MSSTRNSCAKKQKTESTPTGTSDKDEQLAVPPLTLEATMASMNAKDLLEFLDGDSLRNVLNLLPTGVIPPMIKQMEFRQRHCEARQILETLVQTLRLKEYFVWKTKPREEWVQNMPTRKELEMAMELNEKAALLVGEASWKDGGYGFWCFPHDTPRVQYFGLFGPDGSCYNRRVVRTVRQCILPAIFYYSTDENVHESGTFDLGVYRKSMKRIHLYCSKVVAASRIYQVNLETSLVPTLPQPLQDTIAQERAKYITPCSNREAFRAAARVKAFDEPVYRNLLWHTLEIMEGVRKN